MESSKLSPGDILLPRGQNQRKIRYGHLSFESIDKRSLGTNLPPGQHCTQIARGLNRRLVTLSFVARIACRTAG